MTEVTPDPIAASAPRRGKAERFLSLLGALAVTAAFSSSPPAHAHHSFAMYDQTKLVTLVGTVKELQWTNPHVILWVTEDAKPGEEPISWTLELPTSTGNLNRMGWSKHSLAPGDRVAIEMNPLRDGKHGGSFKKATLEASGQVLTASPNPAPTTDAGTGTDAIRSTSASAPPTAAAPAVPPGAVPALQPSAAVTRPTGGAELRSQSDPAPGQPSTPAVEPRSWSGCSSAGPSAASGATGYSWGVVLLVCFARKRRRRPPADYCAGRFGYQNVT
jgi:hypothetical protein